MKIIVRSKTMPVTRALRTFIKKQVEKIDRLGRRISKVAVYLEQVKKKRNDPQASIVKYQVKMPGKDIVIKRKAVDMYDAIVEATNRAARQVRKVKEKRIQKNRGRHAAELAQELVHRPI